MLRLKLRSRMRWPTIRTALMLTMVACSAMLYREVSIAQWHALWGHKPVALAMFTKRADVRYVDAFRRAQTEALRRGWFIPDHDLRQTTFVFGLSYVRWRASHLASINPETREIVIDDMRLSRMTDDDLECVMAHEIGHSIDYRYGRVRDMNLWPYRCETREVFADTVGAMLCGQTNYRSFFQAHIRFRYPGESPCDAKHSPVKE